MCSRLGGVLIAERASLDLSKDWETSATQHTLKVASRSNTSQSIDSPLLELLQGDFGGGRDVIEIQAVGIFLLLV